MSQGHVVKVKVAGEYACFTRPDLKVERMSYPCMTPAAARGVLDSILWKPEFQWHVHRILILKPITFTSVKRNELKEKQGRSPIVIEELRAQRNSIVLRNVAYIIEAGIHQGSRDPQNPPEKYVAMFNRRVGKGQCYRRPFLGCREFAAEFFPVESGDVPISDDVPIGSMLLDIFFGEDGKPEPRFFFDVAIRNGVLDCSAAYSEMLTSTHIRPDRGGEIGAVLYRFKQDEDREVQA